MVRIMVKIMFIVMVMAIVIQKSNISLIKKVWDCSN